VNRKQQRLATRKRLLAVGTEMFARRGVRSTHAADLADAAGVSVGTLYAHFGDKDGLLEAVLRSGIDELRLGLDGLFAQVLGGDTDDVDASTFAGMVVQFVLGDPGRARLLFSPEVRATEVGQRLLDEIRETNVVNIVRCAEAGLLQPQLDPTATAHALLGMMIEVLQWWTCDLAGIDAATVATTLAFTWEQLFVEEQVTPGSC
jgi:AcrR family transcriptional regulator